MTYKIIGDSCLDLTFDKKAFIRMVKECPKCPKAACSSPEIFKEAYEAADAEAVFVITLSSHLSGSYNSAALAKQLYEEEMKEKGITSSKKIEVLDSESASAGQLEQALYIRDLCEQGLNFEEVVEKLRKFRDEMHTYFVLESLDTLRKNGRLSGLQAFFATALNIKPVMGADHGVIIKLDQARGINKGLQRMCDIAVKEAGNTVDKIAVVCHVNHPQRAEYMKSELEKRGTFKDIVITTAAGVATVYANDGGIILAI